MVAAAVAAVAVVGAAAEVGGGAGGRGGVVVVVVVIAPGLVVVTVAVAAAAVVVVVVCPDGGKRLAVRTQGPSRIGLKVESWGFQGRNIRCPMILSLRLEISTLPDVANSGPQLSSLELTPKGP